MVNKKLLDFVKKMLKDGIREATIKRQLLQKGWPEGNVNSALELARTPKSLGKALKPTKKTVKSPEETLKEILPDVSKKDFLKVQKGKATKPSGTTPREEKKVDQPKKVSNAKGMVKKRNIILVYLFIFITFSIYMVYWLVATKNEMNRLGASIPTAWLLILPIGNIYWLYKYCEGFSTVVKKDNNTILWFILYLFIGIIMPAIVQSELNKISC